MSKETTRFETAEFSDPKFDKERSYTTEGFNHGVLVGEIVHFEENNFFAWLRLSKKADGEISSANAICYDLTKGVQFFYEYSNTRDALPKYFGEDPYTPYKAVIHFGSARETEDGRISGDVKYGLFFYDSNGQLRTIKAEQITQSNFERNVGSVNFRQRQDGLWDVYPVVDLQEPLMQYGLKGKVMEPAKAIPADGKEFEIFETVYSLVEENGRMKMVQRTVTNHKRKEVEVPLVLSIPRLVHLFGQSNGEWVQVFKEFPSTIEVTK